MHISLSPLMYLKDFVLVFLDYYILYEVAILNLVKPYNSIAHACSESQNHRTERANISSSPLPPSHLGRGRGVGSGVSVQSEGLSLLLNINIKVYLV